jgi:MoaA/NifB/PqqE/SkfB family radical SAM enzyme
LEGSKPADTRLERIKLADAQPFMQQAVELGVQRFAFTGGEPLIVKDIVKILEYALSLKPCLLLTNGTAPLLKRVHQLELLQKQAHDLSFRVSIDYPNEHQHDAGRGWGNFKRALDGMKLLHAKGFAVSVARQMHTGEDEPEITARFRELLHKHDLPVDTPITSLPDFGRPGSAGNGRIATTPEDRQSLMCTYSRMVVKTNGRMRVYACPFVDDDTNFDLGDSLTTAHASTVSLQHHRCITCIQNKASYS